MPAPTLETLRRYAIARSLFPPTTLTAAIRRLGFVQADPLRAPARAQDLILMHRVRDYRAGELERRYPRLAVEEDYFVNYGFLPRAHRELLHPRQARHAWDATTRARAAEVLAHVEQQGPTHPRQLQQVMAHGSVTSYWGSRVHATTQLLDGLHYRGQLRVARRESGTRVYQAVPPPVAAGNFADERTRAEGILDLIVRLYAPLPAASLGYLATLSRYGAPQLQPQIRAALKRADARYAHADIDGTRWYWPAGEDPARARGADDSRLRFLAPFDPVVWDRRRFARFWGWTYKFEAYTPAAKRTMGHYALPILWGENIPGWATLAVVGGRLEHQLGFVGTPVRDPRFKRALREALADMEQFLGL